MSAFDEYAEDYDRWFETKSCAYQSELNAVGRWIPEGAVGVEIGVGTGRFAEPFHITTGVEPSESMGRIARLRGITVVRAVAEQLPFRSGQFDFALMVTTLCFVDDPLKALQEGHRILREGGSLILAIIDKTTVLGNLYAARKMTSKFYRDAKFYSAHMAIDLLQQSGFDDVRTCQTIFSDPRSMTKPDPVRDGYGEGMFVVIRTKKGRDR